MPCYTEKYDHEMLEQLVPQDLWRGHAGGFDAAVATVPVRAGAESYYGALFAHFDPSEGKCPWLEQGAYLNIDGTVTGCCFMKNPHHAFGSVITDPPELITHRRRELAEKLRQGVVPSPCSGCGIAKAVTRTMPLGKQE
jgi:hypothetical protein